MKHCKYLGHSIFRNDKGGDFNGTPFQGLNLLNEKAIYVIVNEVANQRLETILEHNNININYYKESLINRFDYTVIYELTKKE